MAFSIDDAALKTMFPEIMDIADETLRRGVMDIWQDIARECAWAQFEDVPKNLGPERHRRLIDHVRGVTQMAAGLAETAKKLHGTPYNRDFLIAACLLHDVTKPMESEPDPDGPLTNGPVLPARKSLLGKKIQHAGYAMHKIFAHNLPLELAHLVLTHTHDSGMRSNTIEASYIFFADYADSDAGMEGGDDPKYASRVRFV